MSGKLEEELRDKIRHYEQKEKDLKERERLFEIRMKEQHDQLQEEKTKQEQEHHQKDQELNQRETKMREDYFFNEERVRELEATIEKKSYEYEFKEAELTEKYELQIIDKEVIIHKIKKAKQDLQQESKKALQQWIVDKFKFQHEVSEKVNQESQYKDTIKDYQTQLDQLQQSLLSQQANLELSININPPDTPQKLTEDQSIQCDHSEIFITATQTPRGLNKQTGIEQKYHLLKKKLKKQKEITETQTKDLLAAREHIELFQQQISQKLKSQDTNEGKVRELEVSLSKANQSLKNMSGQINQLSSQRDAFESTISKNSQERNQIEDDLKSLIAYKQEMEQLNSKLRGKVDRKKAQEQYLKETLEYREQELEKKEIILRKMSQSAEDAQKQLKKVTLKLRQIEQTKLKDQSRMIQHQEQQILELQTKLKLLTSNGEQIQTQQKSPLRKQIIDSSQQLTRKSVKQTKIEEVEEQFESTGRFGKHKIHSMSNENLSSAQNQSKDSYKSSQLLPDIKNKKQESIKNSMERQAKDQSNNYYTATSPKQNYDKHCEDFLDRLKDPRVRNNNSFGVKGIFGSGSAVSAAEIMSVNKYEDEVNYEGGVVLSKGNLSSRDEKLRQILENTEKYEKLQYFTPEKQVIPAKMNRNQNIPQLQGQKAISQGKSQVLTKESRFKNIHILKQQ